MTLLQFIVVAICTILNMVDGFDVQAMAFTAPLVQREWAVDPATLGILFSAGLAGMCLGSLLLSPIADLHGRRAVVILSTALVSVGMFASAIAGGVLQLAIFRLMTGLGVGGLLASGNTLLAEYAPDRWRDLSISSMVVGYSVGAIVGGSISAYLIAAFGWRAAFVFGGAASTVLLPFCILYLPESLDFVLSGKTANALARVNAVMRRLGRPEVDSLPDPAREDADTRAVVGIFEPQFLNGTVLICLSFFMLMLSFYFVLSWTPKNLVDLGFTVDFRLGAAQSRRHHRRADVRLFCRQGERSQAGSLYVSFALSLHRRLWLAAFRASTGHDSRFCYRLFHDRLDGQPLHDRADDLSATHTHHRDWRGDRDWPDGRRRRPLSRRSFDRRGLAASCLLQRAGDSGARLGRRCAAHSAVRRACWARAKCPICNSSLGQSASDGLD
jgi:MFS family permease